MKTIPIIPHGKLPVEGIKDPQLKKVVMMINENFVALSKKISAFASVESRR